MINLSLIFAISKNGVIGNNNQIPWHLPGDMNFFRKATTGHTVIMGRKTYESIGKPLPNRNNIIISRQEDFGPDGCWTVSTPVDAFHLARKIEHQIDPEIFVIGGAGIYSEFRAKADRLIVTHVDCECEGDVKLEWMSDWRFSSTWRPINILSVPKETSGEQYDYQHVVYVRKPR